METTAKEYVVSKACHKEPKNETIRLTLKNCRNLQKEGREGIKQKYVDET
jgi:hypothetical protein